MEDPDSLWKEAVERSKKHWCLLKMTRLVASEDVMFPLWTEVKDW